VLDSYGLRLVNCAEQNLGVEQDPAVNAVLTSSHPLATSPGRPWCPIAGAVPGFVQLDDCAAIIAATAVLNSTAPRNRLLV
jgi:hypothetical protein